MAIDNYNITCLPSTQYIGVADIMANMQHDYARIILIISSCFLVYVLWNMFVRAPSHRIKNEDDLKVSLFLPEPVEVSLRAKKLSKAFDELMIVPALVLFYISLSYFMTFVQ